MEYNERITFQKQEHNLEEQIMEKIITSHPEYKTEYALVTADYIGLVDRTMEIVCGIEDLETESVSYEEAIEVLKNMPAEIFSSPISAKSIEYILSSLSSIRYRSFLNATADCSGDDPISLFNRANARAELGRTEEALEDLIHVCILNPDNIDGFISRASLYSSLGEKAKALQDAATALEMLNNSNDSALFSYIQLAYIFHECSDTKLTTRSLLKYTEIFISLLPYATLDNNGGYYINKDGLHMCSSLSSFNNIFELISDIEKEKSIDTELAALIEKLKIDICTIRAFGKF